MCEETGPPTLEDDAWYTHAVVSLDYPKVKRGDKPMEGQMTFKVATISTGWIKDDVIGRELERVEADEQRGREDEAQQFRDHRPE